MTDDTLEPVFPLEFLVPGVPVSSQIKRSTSRLQWQRTIKEASRSALPDGHWAVRCPLAATLYYFPDGKMQGDVDNIVKPILDALSQHIYMDDSQIERVLVQKFEMTGSPPFGVPSRTLEKAMAHRRPLVYVKLSDDPFEDLQ